MEVPLPPGRRVSRRTAGRDDSFQDPAGALGEGPDTNRKEDSSSRPAERRSTPYQNRSLVSPDGEHQLSPDDYAFRAPAARHDHSLLSGMVSDALHRPAAVHGFDVFDLKLLSVVAVRTFPPELATLASLSAIPYFSWYRVHHHHQVSVLRLRGCL